MQEQELLRQTMGVRCRKARLELGLSQRQFAQAMDRSPSWVREVEAGAQFAPPYLLQSLAHATRRSVAWFYGEEPGPDVDRLAESLARALAERAGEPQVAARLASTG